MGKTLPIIAEGLCFWSDMELQNALETLRMRTQSRAEQEKSHEQRSEPFFSLEDDFFNFSDDEGDLLSTDHLTTPGGDERTHEAPESPSGSIFPTKVSPTAAKSCNAITPPVKRTSVASLDRLQSFKFVKPSGSNSKCVKRTNMEEGGGGRDDEEDEAGLLPQSKKMRTPCRNLTNESVISNQTMGIKPSPLPQHSRGLHTPIEFMEQLHPSSQVRNSLQQSNSEQYQDRAAYSGDEDRQKRATSVSGDSLRESIDDTFERLFSELECEKESLANPLATTAFTLSEERIPRNLLSSQQFKTPVNVATSKCHQSSSSTKRMFVSPSMNLPHPILSTPLVTPRRTSASTKKTLSRSSDSIPRTPCVGSTRRKFPGPAGLLPPLAPGQNLDSVHIPPPSTPTPSSTPRIPVIKVMSSKLQSSFHRAALTMEQQEFREGRAWKQMMKDLDMTDPLCKSLLQYNISSVLKQASRNTLCNGKVPHLRVLLKNMVPAGSNASAVLKDPSGEMIATIQAKVLEEHSTELQAGAVLILRQVSVFSPTSRKHYLNITPDNIVRVYPPPPDSVSSSSSCENGSGSGPSTRERRPLALSRFEHSSMQQEAVGAGTSTSRSLLFPTKDSQQINKNKNSHHQTESLVEHHHHLFSSGSGSSSTPQQQTIESGAWLKKSNCSRNEEVSTAESNEKQALPHSVFTAAISDDEFDELMCDISEASFDF